MVWWPSDEAVSAVIDADERWPLLSPLSNGEFVPFDVDKYDGLAVVVGRGRNRKGREVLASDAFQRNHTGLWEHTGGVASGWLPRQRWELQKPRDALQLELEGSTGETPYTARRQSSFAVFFCGPTVTTVEVHRRHGTRVAEVSAGPGWLAVLWTPSDPAQVTAYAADGRRSFAWTSPDETRSMLP